MSSIVAPLITWQELGSLVPEAQIPTKEEALQVVQELDLHRVAAGRTIPGQICLVEERVPCLQHILFQNRNYQIDGLRLIPKVRGLLDYQLLDQTPDLKLIRAPVQFLDPLVPLEQIL